MEETVTCLRHSRNVCSVAKSHEGQGLREGGDSGWLKGLLVDNSWERGLGQKQGTRKLRVRIMPSCPMRSGPPWPSGGQCRGEAGSSVCHCCVPADISGLRFVRARARVHVDTQCLSV